MRAEEKVIIVGADPVGSVMGLALAQAGVPVRVLDAQDAVPTDHRASTLHPSTLAIVAPLGMTSHMLALYDRHRRPMAAKYVQAQSIPGQAS